jgi:TorA maturation chaperone TorD
MGEEMAECLSELNPSEFKSLLNGLALMSQIYWGPTPELCEDLARPALVEEVTELSGVLGAESNRAAQGLLGCLHRAASRGDLQDVLESAYVSIFVNDRGGAAAPIYQSCYDSPDGVLMGRPALMMQERLSQAGIDLAAKTSEPPDHLAVQLEYLYLLLERAYLQDDPSLLSHAREFAAMELLSWVEPMRGRIPGDAACEFYAAATDLLLAMLRLTAGCA